MQLNHEKLDVYQASTEFLAISFSIIQNMPSGYAFLSDQLKRASLSIPLNIAEGNGKFTGYPLGADKAKFYHIARGSPTECGAILDAAHIMKVLDSKQWQTGKFLLTRIVSMLCKML